MENTISQIENYLNGTLKEADRKAFEEQLKTDKELAKEVALYKDMMGGIRLHNNQALKGKLNAIHEKVIENQPSEKKKEINWKLLFGIVLILSLIIAAYFMLQKEEVPVKKVYAAYFQPYELDDSRGNNQQLFEQMQQLYEDKRYGEFLTFVAQDSFDIKLPLVELDLLKGVAHLETGDARNARIFFAEAAKNPILNPSAQWYAALSFLRDGNIKACKANLDKLLSNDSSDYDDEARKLLLELEEGR